MPSKRQEERARSLQRRHARRETERAVADAIRTRHFENLPEGLRREMGVLVSPKISGVRETPVHNSQTNSRNDGYIPPTQWPGVRDALARVESYQGHLQACSRWLESPVRFGTPRPPGLDQFSQPVLTSGILDPKVYLDPKAKGVRDAPDLFQQAVAALASRASTKPDLKSRLALVQAELPVLTTIANKYKLAASGTGSYACAVGVQEVEEAVRDYAS